MEAFPLTFDLPDHPGALLRRLEADDWMIELALAGVEDVRRWTMYPQDLDEAGARLRATRNVAAAEAGKGIRYLVVEHGTTLGTAGFGRSPDGFELFYAMLPEGRGRGLVTAAVRAFLAWLTGQGERVVWLSTLNGNSASEAVALRCGFRRDRRGTHVDGRPTTVWRRQPSTPFYT